MVARGETDVDIQLLAEGLPDARGELGTPVWDDILWQTLEMEDLFQQGLGCLECSGELT